MRQIRNECNDDNGIVGMFGEELNEIAGGEMNHFDRLPRELLERIFDYLDARFVCGTCSSVCEDWHSIVSDQRYWHSRCRRFNITASRFLHVLCIIRSYRFHPCTMAPTSTTH